MKFENTEVWGFEHAMRGMRNPKNSWPLSDSDWKWVEDPSPINPNDPGMMFVLGPKDIKLAQTLIRSGSEHRKFLRQIFVAVDITAPLYWWKEFDTYKVGTVANSCSTMHKIHSAPITMDCFETDDYHPELKIEDSDNIKNASVSDISSIIVDAMEALRKAYLETKNKLYWKELIRWLPEGWLQKRTVTMNYENLLGMCSKSQRRFHKLDEWSESFISWARLLPYSQEFIFIDEVEDDNG